MTAKLRSAPESQHDYRNESSKEIDKIFDLSGSNPTDSMTSSVIMQLPPKERAEKERERELASRKRMNNKVDQFISQMPRMEEKKKLADEQRIKELAKSKLQDRMGEIQAKFAALQKKGLP